jgi:hypothetical protein
MMANGYISIARLYKRMPVLADTNGDHLIAVSDLRTAIAMAAAETGEVHPMPCKIGDKVYGLKHDFLNVVDEMTVTEVGTNGLFASEERVATADKSSYLTYAALGDEWFLSKEDAYKERNRRADNG